MDTKTQLRAVRDRCIAKAQYYETLGVLNPERAATWERTVANYYRYAALADARLGITPESEQERIAARKAELEGRLNELALLLAADHAGLKVENLPGVKRLFVETYNEWRELKGERRLEKKKTII